MDHSRVPPHNLEAEQAVIGAILLEADAFSTAAERLTPADFYRTNHQVIFEAMLKLFEKGEPIDLVSVTTHLMNEKKLDVAGGVPYLTELTESVPTAANIDYYSKIVEEKAILRRLIQTSTDIITQAYTREDEVEAVLDEAERKILSVSSRKNTQSFKSIKDILIEVYDNIEMLHHTKNDVTGI